MRLPFIWRLADSWSTFSECAVVVHTIFHGTPEEARRLADAIGNNCNCDVKPDGTVNDVCHPHRMLISQRTLDGLLWMLRSVDSLREKEQSR
jgi:hypothetical protein